MKKISSYLLLFAIIAALIPAAKPSQDVSAQSGLTEVTIQPEGANMSDTQIVSSAPTSNYGSSTVFGVGEDNTDTSTHRALLDFDLSGLPYDIVAVSATLTITVDEDLSSNPRTLYAYALFTDWVESYASWNYRKSVLVNWGGAGASGSGGDVWATEIGSVAIADDLAPGSEVVMTLDPIAIGAMRKQNFYGIKLQMDVESDDLYMFRSSDYETESNRPKLFITYDPDTVITDPGWLCVEGQYGTHYPLPDCWPEEKLTIPSSPYEQNGIVYLGVNQGWGSGKGLAAGKMQCYPYPRCLNDYEIYFRVVYKYRWTSGQSGAFAVPTLRFEIPGMADKILGSISCANGEWCDGVFYGTVDVNQLPANTDGMFTLGLYGTVNTGIYLITSKEFHYWLYLSLDPFDQDCADTYYVPLPETYQFDPTLETPLGVEGEPSDHQLYPTVIGQNYMVRVEDGPWNNGAANRTDAAVSIDGVNWKAWSEFSLDAFCIDTIPATAYNPDYQILYFTATTETFYIRVNDSAGNFADNTNDEDTPFQFVIGLAFTLAEPTVCETQFTYDPEEDTVASVTVHATSPDVAANNGLTEPLSAGWWYGIEVASGTWAEDTPNDPRMDMEFMFRSTGSIGANTEWQDLAASYNLVYCVSEDGTIVYIQAPQGSDLVLHLRVNDQDLPVNFADNTGTLGVNIYHVTFTRQLNGCELQYDLGSFVSHDEVAANATNGKAFANSFASQDLNISYSYGLTPGATYVLETTDGPWWQTFTGGAYSANQYYYDMKIKTGSEEWTDFATWSLSMCVVDIDALGHQRVYFHVPESGGGTYYLKVANANVFGRGSMGWDIYQGIDLGISGTNNCQDFVYDPEVASGFGSIDSYLPNGDDINGLGTNNYYAIQIESANTASDPPYYDDSGWYESEGGAEHDDLELTIDGTNWSDLPNHSAVLCYYYTPESEELVFFVRVLQGQQWKMRANSETFSNNVGQEYYRVYQASAGALDPWTSCADDYQATVPALNESEWIPPQDEEGVMLMPTLTYTPDADPDGDGVIYWGVPGLEAGHFYMVETQQGPWYDQLPKQAGSYLAQLSSDGGATWYLFDDHPDVICYTKDQTSRYWKAIFEVTPGQQWKIRVADTETEVFTDNSGNLAYRLNLVNEFPVDGPGALVTDYDPGAFDVCSQSLIRPQALTLSEIGSLGNYFGDWIQYFNRSVLSYFAWCPRHTDLLLSAMNALKSKEPLATIAELGAVSKNVTAEVASYDWVGGYDDTSIFDAHSSADVQSIFEKAIPQGGAAVAPWEEGGDLVQFTGNSALPAYYYTCENVFADYLPSRLRSGVCFTSAYWKQTGASFWVQLSLDISAIFMLLGMIKGAAQSLVYMMTGVRPWTKDGAQKMIVDVASGSELLQPIERWRYRR